MTRGVINPLSSKLFQNSADGFSKWQPSHLHCLRDLNRGTRTNAQKSPDIGTFKSNSWSA